MEKVFLDANVLFSAAYKPTRLRELWRLEGVSLISSVYAVTEAETNLSRIRAEAVDTLKELISTMTLVEPKEEPQLLPEGISIVAKDRPILLSAIDSQADYLLTGDIKHFGHLFGKSVSGVMILPPAQYFRLKKM